MKKIKQKHYPLLEIDTSEPDVVQIWAIGIRDASQVVHVERESLKELIEILSNECKRQT